MYPHRHSLPELRHLNAENMSKKPLNTYITKEKSLFVGGYANYILFRAYDGLYEDMLKKSVLIRQCGNYRMLGNEYYRIAVRTKAENDRLIEIFKEVIKEKM